MKILFICTHNRCRSILSEAITNQLAEGLIEARSAGSQPSGEVHPLSLRYLQKHGFSTEGLKSESWHDFTAFEADIVITVCNSAAGESCPIYFNSAVKAHWGLADPSKATGSETEIEGAFDACISEIRMRVERLKEIATRQLKDEQLARALIAVGAQVSK